MREIKPIPLKKLAGGLSTMDKIRFGILYVRISKSDVKEMKDILRSETRGILADMKEPKMSILKAMEMYLDTYIENMSKKDTLKLYMAYLEIKEALDKAQEQYAKFEFLARMYQIYMKEGWTVQPTGELAKKIKKLKESETVKTILGDRKAKSKAKARGQETAKKAAPRKKASRKPVASKSKTSKKKSRR